MEICLQNVSPKGASIYDVRIFLPPPAIVTNQLILILLSAFLEPPPSAHCGRHIWKPTFVNRWCGPFVSLIRANIRNIGSI